MKLAKGDDVMVVGKFGELSYFCEHDWTYFIGKKGVVNYVGREDVDVTLFMEDGEPHNFIFKQEELKYLLSYEKVKEIKEENEKLTNTLVGYEEVIYDRNRTVKRLEDEVKELKATIADLKEELQDAVVERDAWMMRAVARLNKLKQLEEIING